MFLLQGFTPQWDLRSVCSRGPFSKYAPISQIETIQQTVWDMTDVNDPEFPKNASGQPNLAYYYPYGGLITQMIVLQVGAAMLCYVILCYNMLFCATPLDLGSPLSTLSNMG
jgi:hypothetical protein